MIFGELGRLKLPDISFTGEKKTVKNLTQETCSDRGSNPGPLRGRRACYRLVHSGGLVYPGITYLVLTSICKYMQSCCMKISQRFGKYLHSFLEFHHTVFAWTWWFPLSVKFYLFWHIQLFLNAEQDIIMWPYDVKYCAFFYLIRNTTSTQFSSIFT